MNRHYLIIDLEATCDRTGWSHDDSEIIEIGAVLAAPGSLQPVDEFQTFVQPVQNPVLTRFCTELTSITQADVDDAPTFPQALARLEEWLAQRPVLFCSWGEYDRNQFSRERRRHRVTLPWGKGHLNPKRAFAERQGTRPLGMAGALARVGLPLEGTHHRGIDDARNITRLLPWIVGEGARAR